MAQYCISCNKKIGFMDSLNEIVNGSGRGFCNDCWLKISKDMYTLLMDNELANVKGVYEALIQHFKDTELPKDTREQILADLRQAYETRLQDEGLQGGLDEIRNIQLSAFRDAENFSVTTGFNFEGHDIIEYIDVLTEVDVQAPGFFGLRNAEELSGNIISARKNATHKLKLRALEKGANALIGIDYDVLTMGESVSIIATGTAVKIKKRGAE